MIEALIEATKVEVFKDSTEPFSTPMPRKHVLIVGGGYLGELSQMVNQYAVTTTILIPTQTPKLDLEYETEKAAKFEEDHQKHCRGFGIARDLSGVDTDSVDVLIVASLHGEIRETFLSQAWRVVRELGKVVVFANHEVPLSYLGEYGMAGPVRFPVEGFYVGSMRKASAVRAQN